MTPFEETVANQQRAADPARSAFVMANAGSGKTRVLTNRVARLLLQGVDPVKILCITFTKAAAAEMAERLFDVLGEWSLASDEALLKALSELEGSGSPARNANEIDHVRRLFARALETPGGLKIQTIHSFCESVLKRFPLESGVAPGFSVLDDHIGNSLIAEAIDETAALALHDPSLADAFARLTAHYSETTLRPLFQSSVGKDLATKAVKYYGGLAEYRTALAGEINADPAKDPAALAREFMEVIQQNDLDRAYEALHASGGNPKKLGASAIGKYRAAQSHQDKWKALAGFFLTASGDPRKKLTTAATEKHDPWTPPFLADLQARFIETHDAIGAAKILDDTGAFLEITMHVADLYNDKKKARASLDYDDLINRTRALFDRTDAAWIMYKLDQGLDHILIDEAQDTSPAQWDVVEAPLEEFFSGAGARELERTFFAVGDKKQSIYSFQGADVDLFSSKEVDLAKKIAVAGAYENISLTLSFRTTQPVLNFVDTLFEDKKAAEGLGGYPIPAHGVHREGDAGLVELWPLTPKPEKTETRPWDAPVDAPAPENPVKLLCAQIAETIKNWIKNKTILESRGRPIRPGDIMVLVQSRGRLFNEVIRTLAHSGIPVAGADKLKLLEDPAIEDILSYIRFSLLESDDLSLAEILKSPFFGFDDDADLFPLAHGRPKGKSLWASLCVNADKKPHWQNSMEEIARARNIGLRQGPYAFISHLLDNGQPSGRHRLYKRLTNASRDAIDEMLRMTLEFENSAPRSLQEFLEWFEAGAGEIKREMDRTKDAVRVMTVHGAKGLESDIVFLLDTHRGPNIRQAGPLVPLTSTPEAPDRPAELFAFVTGKNDCPATSFARDETRRKQYEEYRRLLYVAATRARDRLYICGIESGNLKDPNAKPVEEQTWHTLAESAFDRLVKNVETLESELWKKPVRRIACKQTTEPDKQEPSATQGDLVLPDWLFSPAQKEAAPITLAPSRLADEEADDTDTITAPDTAYSPTVNHDKYFRGRTLHRLLELLPEIEPEKQTQAADKLLAKLAPEFSTEVQGQWRDEVMTVLAGPNFAEVFAPGSRAEVSIVGKLKGARRPTIISGQIDRLAVTEDHVLIVDYKTNRPPPAVIENANPAYIAQMAAYRALLQEIYPNHQIDAALLWTWEARLMPIPPAMLDAALAETRLRD